MHSSSRIVMALVAVLILSACDSAPKWTPPGSSGGIIAEIYGVIGAKTWFETSAVVLMTYQLDQKRVRVLLGPNDGTGENARVRIAADGDLEIESGFAYMSVSGGSGEPRPYIRTPRVKARGNGSAWAVQIRQDPLALTGPEDRIYFVEGSYIECATLPGVTPSGTLNFTENYWFTHYPVSSTEAFATAVSYVSSFSTPDPLAVAFATFVDNFTSGAGLPSMNP